MAVNVTDATLTAIQFVYKTSFDIYTHHVGDFAFDNQ